MAFAFSDERWLPKSILCLRDYNLNKFAHDVIAGITVGLVALPLAMAFSIASGLTPQAGIYCAIVTGLLISALGGSKTQIGGPTGAFVVVVAGIVAAHGVDGLFMCTVMAGILLVVMGATGMGTGVKFIPRPVVIGFTNGIAVLIASTQVKDFFGLHLEKVPGVFWLRMKALAASFPTWSPTATILAVATVATMLRSEEHTSELQSPSNLVCRLLLEKNTLAVGPASSPTPTPTKEEQVQRVASSQIGHMLDAIGYGEPQWPEAVGLAVALEGSVYVVRALLVDKPEAKKLPIPFVPQLVSGPPFTSDAASVLPEDIEVFVSASIDLTQTYEGMRKAAEIKAKAAKQQDRKSVV